MDKNIPSARVRVYKDRTGFYPAGSSQRIDCRDIADMGRQQLYDSAVSLDGCGMREAGDTYDPKDGVLNLAGTTLIDTVKIRGEAHGYRWVNVSDYDALIASCNGCCGT